MVPRRRPFPDTVVVVLDGMETSRPEADLGRGALLMVAAAALFSLMAAAVQMSSEALPGAMVVFFRNAVATLVLAPFVLRQGLASLRTRRFGEHLLRTVAGLTAMYCFFHAIAHLRLADAVLLNYTLPLFIPLVEALWLKEPAPPRVWGPIALGFLGVLLVLKPGVGLYQRASLVGLVAGLMSAVAQTGIRRMTASEPTLRIVFYFALLSSLFSALPLPFAWVTPGPRLWALLALTGATAALAQFLMTRAYSYAPAAQVGAFIYTGVPFAILIDWVRRHRLPDRASLVGALCICGAGAAMLRVAGRRRANPG
jgi:drug/metabolite transporter (DMT)-like permease